MDWFKSQRERLYKTESVAIFINPELELEQVLKKSGERCAIIKIIRVGFTLKILPFRWDEESDKITVASLKNRIIVNINLSGIFIYVGIKLSFFYTQLCKQHTAFSNPKVPTSITGSLFFVLFALALLLHFNNILHCSSIVCTANTYCGRIRDHLGEIFNIQKSIRLLDVLWTVYVFIIHIILIVVFCVFVTKNKSNISLYRYFGGSDWKIYVIFLLVDLYCVYSFVIIVGFYVFLCIDCAAIVEKLSKNMTSRIHGITHICLSIQRIQELKYLQRCYNEIQIGLVSYKLIMEPLVFPLFLAVAVALSSVGLFTMIKYDLGIFFSMALGFSESLCISVTSFGLCKASNICDNNELLQKELCHLQLVPKKNKHELKVIMKCIRPIRFKIGTFFPVSKQTATDFLETLCSWLTTLLLTHG